MVMSYPHDQAAFEDRLVFPEVTFRLGAALEMNETGAGELITTDVGERLWRAAVTVAPRGIPAGREQQALVEDLLYAGRSVLLTPAPYTGPQEDLDGSVYTGGSGNAQISSATTNDISLTGMPSGYTLRRGDFLSWTYSSSPTRYALHRVSQVIGVANGSGAIDDLEVTPFVRSPGSLAGTAVELFTPVAKMVLEPGGYSAPRARTAISEGLAFSARQTFR